MESGRSPREFGFAANTYKSVFFSRNFFSNTLFNYGKTPAREEEDDPTFQPPSSNSYLIFIFDCADYLEGHTSSIYSEHVQYRE